MNFLRIYGKRFVTTSKTLKFQNVNKDIKYNTHKLDTKVFEDNLRVVKTGPEKGEFLTLPTMPSKSWALSMGYNDAFKRDPVSAYYSIKVRDTMFHVFNAARYPLGRMAAKIAFIIQGKNSPHYRPNKVEPNTDRCIILNAKNVYLTGNKLKYKMYRHHSGYPGGLKEISAKHYLEKDCKEMITRTIKGMIPKNKMRLLFLSKVKIYEESGHDLHHLGLPQFASVQSLDYNDILGNNFSKNDLVISDSNVSPEQIDELFPQVKHLKKELKEGYMKPEYMRRERDPKPNLAVKSKYQMWTESFRRKHYKRIRKMSYRYI